MSKIFAITLILFSAQIGLYEGTAETHARHAFADTKMEEFLKMESTLIENMEKYVEALEQKLIIMNKATEEMMTENDFALLDAEKYLGNPLKSFSLIRRLHSDWKAWRDYLLKPVGEDFLKTMQQVLQKKPGYKDFIDAVEAVHNVQLIYNLQADDMVKGLLNGMKYDASLAMPDAFSIGMELHKMGYSHDGLGWLETAMRLEHDGLYKQYFSLDAKTIFEDYKKIAEESALPYLPLKVIQSDAYRKLKKLNSQDGASASKFDAKLETILAHRKNSTTAFENNSSMFCYKFPIKQKLLPFAALKLELLRTKPNTMLYHDVLPDSMTSILIDFVEYHSAKCADYNALNTKPYRLINNTFHQEDIDKIIERLTLVTGLTTDDYEAPTKINFGIDGHRNLHVDFFNNACGLNDFNGSHQTSLLIYLNDIVESVTTVLPKFELSITPRKGSILIWQDLYPNGTISHKTAHSLCPFVVGSKWIMNWWMRQKKLQTNIAN